MGIQDAYENIMKQRERNKKIGEAKYIFLQRLSMEQLEAIYQKYCYIEPPQSRKYTKESPNGPMDIYNMVVSPSQPNTRQKYVDKIMSEMTWDSLKRWAEENHVEYEEVK